MPKFNVEYALLCEDARQEASGQHTLVGVFGAGQLAYKSFPAKRRNLVAFAVFATDQSDFHIEYRLIESNSKDVVGSGEVRMEYAGEKDFEETQVEIALDLGNTEFPCAGRYDFQLKFPNSRWKSAAFLRVSKVVDQRI